MVRRQAFADAIENNMRDLVSHTYTVSKQYSEDNPKLSMSYNPDRHRLDVTIDDDEIIIPLKYNRLNKRATLELFDEAKQTSMAVYPVKGGISEYDDDIIKQTHALCLKHMDLNRESEMDDAFFTFNAGNGELSSTIQTRDAHAKDMDVITLVDAQCDRYDHLNESARLSYIREEITEQVSERNRVFDRHLDHVQSQSDVSLRDDTTQPDDEASILLSFDGLDEQDHSHEM